MASAAVADAMDSIIDRSHPSFGTSQAVFMFAMTAPDTGSLNRFILVEARCAWAVQTVERILGSHQTVSDNCKCLGIFRETRSLGTRDDMLEEVPYVDFMLDIVDPARLFKDALVSSSFAQSLTEEERAYAVRKIESESQSRTRTRKPVAVRVPAVQTASPPDERMEKLTNALLGLGFRKQAVQKYVDSVRHSPESDMRQLVKEACRALAA